LECENKFPLHICDTLSGDKVELGLDREKEFRMFICGPTVQDNVHVGHAKTYFAFDVLARWIRSKGVRVFFLMNITDVDDKIFDRAKREDLPYMQVADRFYRDFIEDLEALNIVTVTKFARVSKYINESAELVKKLRDSGKAYLINSSTYFDTSKADHFGKLSHQNELDLKMKVIDAAPGKKNSVDFLLWRNVVDAREGVWNTIAGVGRPGWHIEDSAIAFKEFGGPYDLHGGATELIFPHHEAELAQDEAASEVVPFVSVWMHTGLLLKNGEKMSKSLGNVMTIREALSNCDGNLLRVFFLGHHYRDSFNFSPGDLLSNKDVLGTIRQAAELVDSTLEKTPSSATASSSSPLSFAGSEWKSFSDSMDNDLDTPRALKALLQLSKEILSCKDDRAFLLEKGPVFQGMVEVLGLRLP